MVRPDRTLNGPTLMQSETHFNLKSWHSILKLLVSLVFHYVGVLVNLGDNLQEAEKSEVSQLLIFLGIFCHLGRRHVRIEEFILKLEFPYKKEGISYVLVGRPTMLVNH